MVFQKGKKNVICYLTPVGELVVGIETKDIEITETEDSLKVDVEYALEINYDHIADCSSGSLCQVQSQSGRGIGAGSGRGRTGRSCGSCK